MYNINRKVVVEVKYQLIIDKEQEESIVIVSHEKNNLVKEIEKLINDSKLNLIGYIDNEITPLNVCDVYAFYTDNGKVYASTKDKNYLIKERIYALEELLESFVKINQGCLINIKKILKFESNFGGSIKVILKNNFSDYISRRELKNVKRRLGL